MGCIITPFVRSFSDADQIFSFRCIHEIVRVIVRIGEVLLPSVAVQLSRQTWALARRVPAKAACILSLAFSLIFKQSP